MSYRNCPSCKASNRQQDPVCYSCSSPMDLAPSWDTEASSSPPSTAVSETVEVTKSLTMGLVAVLLSTFLGGGLGFALEYLELEIPFFFEELALGLICALAAAFNLGKFQEMPEGLLSKRLGPAALFGALVGVCLYAIWWTFDPSSGLLVVGMIAGFCAGLPIVVSFGLAGGESRPLGQLEFLNVGASMALGLAIGLFIGVESEDLYIMPGMAGIFGLIPTLLGGRINLYELFSEINWGTRH